MPVNPLQRHRLGALTTCLGNLLRFVITLLLKKCFLMFSLNLPGTTLNHPHVSHHWTPGRRDQHLPLHFSFLGSHREQWGHPSCSSKLDEPKVFTAPHRTFLPALSPALLPLPSSGHGQGSSHPYEIVGPEMHKRLKGRPRLIRN